MERSRFGRGRNERRDRPTDNSKRYDKLKITPRYTGQELRELRATERPTDWPFSGCVTLSVSRWGLKGNQGPPPGVGEPEKGVSREREARGEAGRAPLRRSLPTLSAPFPAPSSSSASSSLLALSVGRPGAPGYTASRNLLATDSSASPGPACVIHSANFRGSVL